LFLLYLAFWQPWLLEDGCIEDAMDVTRCSTGLDVFSKELLAAMTIFLAVSKWR
jgi:hypothetical protein